MKIQIYGVSNCDHCLLVKNALDIMKIDYEFLDAEDDTNSAFLDSLNVELLPYVLISDDNENIVFSKSGKVTITEIVSEIKRSTRDSG